MRPTAILLCGLPYSGKTTLAAALRSEGYRLISLDAINQARGLGIGGASVPGFEWEETHHRAITDLRESLAAGQSVVWDDTNYAAWIRDPIFEAAIEAGAEPLLVFVDCPLSVVQARKALAEAGQADIHWPEADYERMVREFEKPCCSIRIDGTQSLEAALAVLRKALGRNEASHSGLSLDLMHREAVPNA